MNKFLMLLPLIALTSITASAQNANSSTTTPRPRTTNTNRSTPPSPGPPQQATPPTTPKPSQTAPTPRQRATGSTPVVQAFNRLIDGIQKADVDQVMSVYWNSPGLILFNNNGTVTKSWEQVKKNRESSYPDLKDVKLEIRDLSVLMIGRDGAVITCLWTQSQTYKDTPETASGRMTLVFRKIGSNWKAIHLHTSPDKPDASRVLPSEQPSSSPIPSPTPNQ